MLVFDIILMMLLLMLLVSLCPQVSLLPLLLRMVTPTHLPLLPLLLLLGGGLVVPRGLVSTIPPRTPTTWVHAHPPYRRKQQTLKQKEINILHNILEVTKSPLLYTT